MNIKLLLFLILLFAVSCVPEPEDVIVEGMAPLYSSFDDFAHVQREDPRPPMNLGKIVSVGDFLFINEQYQGIHVVDNTDPTNPEYVHFWKILGNTEFTIEGSTLYADNTKHLVVIDITDYSDIKYVKHIEDFYDGDFPGSFRPPNYTGQFECVDPNIGIVVTWELKTLTNPLCIAF